MKHTPGPWVVHHNSHIDKKQWLTILNGAFDIDSNGASNPAIVACSRYSVMSDEENLANANIMASSLEMLETLIEIRNWYETHHEKFLGTYTPVCFSKALSIILKATKHETTNKNSSY